MLDFYNGVKLNTIGGLLLIRMGLQDVGEDEFPVDEGMTLRELIDIHGKEAVRRGVRYIHSLSDADEEYRESADRSKMREGYERGYKVDTSGNKDVEEATSRWEDKMRKNGIGIDEE